MVLFRLETLFDIFQAKAKLLTTYPSGKSGPPIKQATIKRKVENSPTEKSKEKFLSYNFAEYSEPKVILQWFTSLFIPIRIHTLKAITYLFSCFPTGLTFRGVWNRKWEKEPYPF